MSATYWLKCDLPNGTQESNGGLRDYTVKLFKCSIVRIYNF